MNAVTVLEWAFSPRDYFAEVVEILAQDYTMTIRDGQAHAKIDSAIYQANPDMRQRSHNALNSRFLAAQLLGHRPYELSRSTMILEHPEGRRDIFIELVEGISVRGTVGTVYLRHDKDGNVIANSKRDRIEEEKRLAELIAFYLPRDTLLASLFRSQTAAAHDPDDELVHLYEIRDALDKKFGGKPATLAALGFSSTKWSRFGSICNEKPLRQGRHRGRTGEALRDATATEGELIEARGIAQAMIESYLQYLEASASPC
jgi:hypothetical protein